jgi:hypothetical protein
MKNNLKYIILCLLLIILITLLLNRNNLELFTESSRDDLPPFPIDVVYTWAGEYNNTTNARLSNNNELKYSIRSVIKYAPWVNKIFILMNPPKKIPSWFNESYKNKIILVDHNDTFKRQHMPCTNSNSIETTIINIPGLSEHFIYFNDDVFLGNNVSYLNFFNKDGSKIIVDDKRIENCKSMIIENTISKVDFKLPEYCGVSQHIPFANKKSIIRKYQETYSDYVEWVRNIRSRKGTGRTACNSNNLHKWCQQQHGPIGKFAYENGDAIIKSFDKKDIVYIAKEYDPELERLDEIKQNRPLFFCVNDVKINDDNERKKFYDKFNHFMEEYFNEHPVFEV